MTIYSCLATSPSPAEQSSSDIVPAASSSPRPATATGSVSSSTSTATQTYSSPSVAPTSDYSTLPNPYPILSSQFTLYCNSDFYGQDLIAVYVYRFEDCIYACENYNHNSATHPNSTCAGAVFQNVYGPGEEDYWRKNCLLKATPNIKPSVQESYDGAMLVRT